MENKDCRKEHPLDRVITGMIGPVRIISDRACAIDTAITGWLKLPDSAFLSANLAINGDGRRLPPIVTSDRCIVNEPVFLAHRIIKASSSLQWFGAMMNPDRWLIGAFRAKNKQSVRLGQF